MTSDRTDAHVPELPSEPGGLDRFEPPPLRPPDPVEITYFTGVRRVSPATFAWVFRIVGGVLFVVTVLTLATGSPLLTTLLLIVLALAAVGLALLPTALASARAMTWLASRTAQLETLLPDVHALAPWMRKENGSAAPPDDLAALVAELASSPTVSLGGLDGLTATQQVFATDVAQKVLDQYPPSPPMMGSESRTRVAPRGAA